MSRMACLGVSAGCCSGGVKGRWAWCARGASRHPAPCLSCADEDEDDDEDDEEAPPAKPLPPAKAGAKRPQQPPAKTPQPQKKARQEQPKAPATAPPKVASAGGAGAVPTNEQEYVQALRAKLEGNGGSMKLAALGSGIQRPKAVPKMKACIEKHGKVFKYDAKSDSVALA